MSFRNFELEDLYNNLEDSIDYSLSSACLDPLSINSLIELSNILAKSEFIDSIMNLGLDYSSKFGINSFQESLKHNYGNDLNFISTSGASEAIVLTFTSLFSKGDKIIVQKPIYASLFQIAEDLSVQIIDWDCDWSEDFNYNFVNLKKIIEDNNDFQALVINNPNNPTGLFFQNSELNQLIDLVRSNDAYFIADEVFKDLVQPELGLKSVVNLYRKGISISDVSKAYGLQGLRTGWIAVQDSALREKFLKQKNYFSLRTSILGEYLAGFALKHSESILGEARSKIERAKNKLFQDNAIVDSTNLKNVILNTLTSVKHISTEQSSSYLNRLSEIFESSDFELSIRKEWMSGLSCFVKFVSGQYSLNDFYKFLLAYRILLVPGKVYGSKYQDYFRLGLVKLVKNDTIT